MSHHHMHHSFAGLAIVAAIAFAFGPRVARICVAGVLLTALAAFAYVAFRVVMGTI